MNTSKTFALLGFLLFSTSCGLIDGELLRPSGKTDLGSITPDDDNSNLGLSLYRPDYDVNDVNFDSQGRKIIAGDFYSLQHYRRGITSLRMDGSINNLFNEGLGAEDSAHSIRDGAYQADGKLVVVGRFTTMNGVTSNDILRLNADGTPDLSFAVTGTGFNSNYITGLAIQPDGKIVVIGDFSSYNGTSSRGIARLNSDGTLDTSFSTNIGTGVSSLGVYSVALQTDGKILVGGAFTSFNGQANTQRMIRLNTDGTLDGTFSIGSGFNGTINDIEVLSDGKILVGGDFTTYNGVAHVRLVKLNPNGTVDGGFTLGLALNNDVHAIAIQSDGKILIGGSFWGAGQNCLARLDSSGAHDATFNSGNTWDCSDADWVGGILIRTDGKIFVTGQKYTDLVSYADSIGIVLHNTDGSVDSSFVSGHIGIDVVESAIFSPDGYLIPMGTFTWMGSISTGYLYRETADGQIDSSFASGTGFDDEVHKVIVLADDSMIVGGRFTQYDSTSSSRIAKILEDGTLDPSFVVGTGFAGGSVLTMDLQSDGKIIVGGTFTSYKGTAVSRIARINSDGSLDTAFTTANGTGFPASTVKAIKVQADGKILVGGTFTTFNGVGRVRMLRLNADGTLDNGFTVGTGFSSDVNAIGIQSDGKILAGGIFTTYNGVARNYIVRLDSDGTADGTFNMGTGFNGVVQSLTLQSDGKILIGGYFTAYQGVTANRLIRLNADGSADAGFNTGTGTDGVVFGIAVSADGEILAGGNFYTYQDEKQPMLVILNTDGSKAE